jgi:hypothetical protein
MQIRRIVKSILLGAILMPSIALANTADDSKRSPVLHGENYRAIPASALAAGIYYRSIIQQSKKSSVNILKGR